MMKKACGPDNISGVLLKECAKELGTPIYSIFNKSIRTGKYPGKFKHANVVPIFKGGLQKFCGKLQASVVVATFLKLF